MTDSELEQVLGNWLGWRRTYGSSDTDEGMAFKQTANQQIGRIRREIARRKRAS